MAAVTSPRSARLWRAGLAGYLVFLGLVLLGAYLGLVPTEAARLPLFDTLGHFGLIGLAALLLDRAWRGRRTALPVPGGRVSAPTAALVVCAVALVEECAQLLSRRRTFDPMDLLADAAGAFAFCWGAAFLVGERARYPSYRALARTWAAHLARLALKLAAALAFPLAVFAALAATRALTFPVLGLHRYDALLLLLIGVQLAMLRLRHEAVAALPTLLVFHALGLGLELYKVQLGSWAYPEPAWSKVGGVPLYSGFMYASVASFLIQLWDRLDLRLERFPGHMVVVPLAAASYLNFFALHVVADVRWLLLLAVLLLFLRSRLAFVNTGPTRRVPVAASLVGLALFVWMAENVATFFGAWAYPHQADGWAMVEPAKVHSWFLLGLVAFVLVAGLKERGDRPATHSPFARSSPQISRW